jgi:glycosyltransferase involved in cell wall biosynthesis
LRQFAYHLWQRRILPIAADLHRKQPFDIVHQVTYNTYREPGYVWKLGAPFIWGPIGGTQNYPWAFLRKAGFRGALGEFIRNCLNLVQLHASRRFRRAGQTAKVLIAANSTAQRDLRKYVGRDSVLMSDTGCDKVSGSQREPHDGPMRIIWSGLVTPRKALHLLLEALSLLPVDVKYELHVVGVGPESRRCKKLAARLGVDSNVKWLGWLSHDQAKEHFLWADVFAFTSLRDTTGTVLSEALCHGVPIICFDHQGARDIVTDRCGIKIPVVSPKESIQGLADAIACLARDRSRLRAMGLAAKERSELYLWNELGRQMAAIYEGVLKANGSIDSSLVRDAQSHSELAPCRFDT